MALQKETLGFWEKLIKMSEKYGYWKLTKVVMFVVFTITMLCLGKNFGENYNFKEQKALISQVIDEKDKSRIKTHSNEMKMRTAIKPYVTGLLKSTLIEMGADRAFVIELHNGTNNTTGLPFVHCTMTYEEDAKGIETIDEDYQNLTLSRFSFPEYLHEHGIWFGDVDEFAKIDPKIASRLKNNNVTYLAVANIRADADEIGYYGFTYCYGNKPKSEKEIMEYIVLSVQKLSRWLNMDLTTSKDGKIYTEDD